MADVGTPPSTPPPAPPPPKKGMSTGAKVAIGCGIALIVAIVAVIIAVAAGGMFVSKKASEFAGGLEAQQKSSETIQELEREHPFAVPQDGVVSGDRAERFFEVTDDAWERMEDWIGEMEERGQRIESRGGQAGLGDAMAGLQGFGRSRVALAEALDDNDMPVSEYLWTGMALARAYEALDQPGRQGDIPPENLEIAAGNRRRLAEITEGDGDSNSRAVVLAIAWTLASAEGMMHSIPGIDTLMR